LAVSRAYVVKWIFIQKFKHINKRLMKTKGRDFPCPLRLKCALANEQGKVKVIKGYIDNKCNFYVKLKEVKNETT